MRFRGVLALAVLITFLIASHDAYARPYLDSARVAALIRIQDFILNDCFREADSASLDVIRQDPSDPIGYIVRASSMLAEMFDREDNPYAKRFDALLDSTESLSGKVADTADRPTQAWMHLINGHVLAYRSIYESRFGSFTSAIRKGLAVKGEYGKALELDSTLYDIYAGLGGYHYWKSVKAGFLRWIGIFRDDKDKGIRELHLAADSSLISRQTAHSSLIWIWLDAGKYDSALAIASEMLTHYPDGRSFLWPQGQAYFRMRDYQHALGTFSHLRELLAADPGNYFNLIECDQYITKCWELNDRRDKAREAAQRFLSYQKYVSEQIRERQSDHIRYLKRIAGGQ